MAQFQIFSYFYDVIYCLWHHNHWFCLEHLASKFSRNNVFYGYYVNNTQGSGQTWKVWNKCVFCKMGIFLHFYILALKFPNKGCICLDIILQRNVYFQKKYCVTIQDLETLRWVLEQWQVIFHYVWIKVYCFVYR